MYYRTLILGIFNFMGLNMSWKTKFVCVILGKKVFVFDQGERKRYVFLLEGEENGLVRK